MKVNQALNMLRVKALKKEKSIDENPFKDEQVAREWIDAIENEKGRTRDKIIYPMLSDWVKEISPDNIVEVGAGQGICSDKIDLKKAKYIGIDSSAPLIARAKELYQGDNIKFIAGDAYALPLEDDSIDAIFSVNLWFHLENIKKAAVEMNRVLKDNGKFIIITANPKGYKLWDDVYYDCVRKGKKIIGKVILTQEKHLSKNTFYKHSMDEITESLRNAGLIIDYIEDISSDQKKDIFVAISGYKVKKY